MTATSPPSDLAKRIVDLVARNRGGVSFVELERLDGFRGPNALMFPEFGECLVWNGVSDEAVAALADPWLRERVAMRPTVLLVYIADGKILDLPIAKSHRKYVKLRWLPVVFNLKGWMA